MSLQKQLVHLNLTGGLQTKDDPFLVIPSKLVVADNVEFDDKSTVKVRGGQTLQGTYTGTPRHLFTHGGEAVLQTDSVVQWVGGGFVINPQVISGQTNAILRRHAGMTTKRVAGVQLKNSVYGAGNPVGDGAHDCATTTGGITCHVYDSFSARTSRMQSHYVIVDESNDRIIARGELLDGANITLRPRVHATPTGFVVAYASYASGATTFNVRGTIIAADGTIGASANLVAAAATSLAVESASSEYAIFDTAPDATGANFGLICRVDDGPFTGTDTYNIKYFSSTTLVAAFTGAVGAAAATANASACTLVTSDGVTTRVHLFWAESANVVYAASMNAATGVVSGTSTVGTGPAATIVKRITARQMSTTQIQLAFDCATYPLYGVSSTLHLSRFSHTYGALAQCDSVTPWLIGGSIGLVGSTQYLPMIWPSTINASQSTVYVVDLDQLFNTTFVAGTPPAVAARIDFGECAVDPNRLSAQTQVPRVSVLSEKLIVPYLKRETELRLVGGTTVNANDVGFAVASATLDFNSQIGQQEVNGLTYIAGACPQIFDGQALVEEGFHHAPELLAAPTVVAGAGGTYDLPVGVAATYTVCFTYAWMDAQGNWHESAPSPEYTVTTTVANYSFNVNIALPPTQKQGARLIMYRTLGSSTDTSLYQHTKQDGTQVTTDAGLVFSEQLYTAGGVLPNTPMPACRHLSIFQKRLVASGCGDGSRVYWSKQYTTGYGVEFNSGDPTHQTAVPTDKGRVVGTAEMDDRLVILCERGVGVVGGTGPDATGTQGQYSDFSTIVTETGADWSSPRSIARGPEGVWFRSPFGIRLVSRGGSLAVGQDGKQVGAEVDALVSGAVNAVTGPSKQQIRFYQPSVSTVLVWDYQWRQWTRFTGFAHTGACYADNRFYTAQLFSGDTRIRFVNESSVVEEIDAGGAGVFVAYIKTAPITFAGIQGFQRIYRLMVLGQNAVSGAESWSVEASAVYDYSSAATTLGNFVGAADGDLFQFQHHFAKQKCESLQLEFSIYPFDPGAADGRFRLTDLTLQVGVKSGYFKLPSSARI